ncbi:GH1 family beta-glucosidase [Caldanaerobius polysaccharolyticus]|uniref:GH1 family beta-glucosidase n=1 Tax=Caldanaerobius polysaccharolyticus TaxID=44256 RepID=UPI00047BDDC1|nr:GH1 family beta-glucosidase [Caldanaerobius polysaccharolyticus]
MFKFPEDFIWGTATAAYQIEGAANEDGRGESIWDRFSHIPGNVWNNQNGDVACDHYHRYKEDVQILKDMGVKGYRFSISWPRVIPEGTGKINQKGVDFYNGLIDELLKYNIQPFVTLYHWDLPQALQYKGGWANRDTAEYFADYASEMFRLFGDRVKHWITHNEPWCTSFLGHAIGVHAPGIKDFSTALQVAHNVLLSHGKAVQYFRQAGRGGKIGITLNLTPVYAASDREEDVRAATVADGYSNRWFLDPVFKGQYPEDMLKNFGSFAKIPDVQVGDMKIISSPMDFLGVNYYTRSFVKYNPDAQFGTESLRPDGQYTEMDWEVYPQGLYDLLMRLKKDYGDIDIYITENGAAFKDVVENNSVDDSDRLNYLKMHFEKAAEAIRDGVKLKGYFVWSLMDNFEWAHGYSKRFGLIYVDYETQKRIWKKSALWYKDVIANNSL